jgi:uncharacterized protein
MSAANGPARCVSCRKRAQEAAWRHFCSERCKLADLAQWADGGYRVAAEPDITDDEALEALINIPDHDHAEHSNPDHRKD